MNDLWRVLIATSMLAHPARAAFSTQPTAVNTAPTALTIRSVSDTNDNVRCVVLAHGATAPNAAEVNAGTGNGGSTAAANPPAVTANANSNADVSITGLTAGTRYNAYCATASGGILSNLLDFYTSGFTTQPIGTSIEDDRFTMTMTSALSENVRCVVVFDGVAAPTASEVNVGAGNGGSIVQASGNAASATAGSSVPYLITGLASDTDYDVYCATAAGQISVVASVATSGYRTEPYVNTGAYAADTITASFVSYNTENIRCVAVTVGTSPPPTGSAINTGGSVTGQQGNHRFLGVCLVCDYCSISIFLAVRGGFGWDCLLQYLRIVVLLFPRFLIFFGPQTHARDQH